MASNIEGYLIVNKIANYLHASSWTRKASNRVYAGHKWYSNAFEAINRLVHWLVLGVAWVTRARLRSITFDSCL